MTKRLTRQFFSAATEDVAKALLGQTLVSCLGGKRTSGRIVETEAYLPDADSACHAAKSRTPRTEVMFGKPGLAYVYPIHAKHCFNVVTESAEQGCAVLIRALEPLEGIDTMEARRGLTVQKRLTTGPACLCQALAIDRSLSGEDLIGNESLWIEEGEPISAEDIRSTVRIGVTSAEELELRYVIAGNAFVSGPARLR